MGHRNLLMLLQIHRFHQLLFTGVLFGVLFFPKSCLNVGGAAYTRVRLIHESLRYLFISELTYSQLKCLYVHQKRRIFSF